MCGAGSWARRSFSAPEGAPGLSPVLRSDLTYILGQKADPAPAPPGWPGRCPTQLRKAGAVLHEDLQKLFCHFNSEHHFLMEI